MYSARSQQASNNRRDDAYECKDSQALDEYGRPVQSVVQVGRLRFEIALAQLIEGGHAEEWTLLQYLAWLDYEFISEELLLEVLGNDQGNLWKVIENLERLSLVKAIYRKEVRGIAIDREVQDHIVTYATSNPGVSKEIHQLLGDMLVLLNNFLPKVTDKYDESWQRAIALVPTVEAMLLHSVNRGIPIPEKKELASLNAKLGVFYEIICADARKGLDYKERVLEIDLILYEDAHPDVAEALNAVGSSHYKLGDMKEALARFETSLAMYKAIYEKDHPDIANSLDSIGILYHLLIDNEKALACFEEGLNMRQALYKGAHPDVARSLNLVGLIYQELGDVRKSLDYVERALNMRQALYQGVHPDVAISLDSVGVAYQNLFDREKALDHKKRAFIMRQALYPSGNHPDIAASLNNVGLAYQALEDVRNGLDYLEQALIMRQALYPSGNHPDIAASLNNVGLAYQALGDVRKGLNYLESALIMRQALYPSGNHYDVAASLNDVGNAYQALGDVKKGLNYLESALIMRQALYPSGNHPDVAISLNNVGNAYCTLGDMKKGLDYQERALIIMQAIYSCDHPNVAGSLNNVGVAYEVLGDVKKGLDYHKRALIMRQALYPYNHHDVAASLNNVGCAYKALGNVNKGLDYYKRALIMMQVLYPSGNHPDVAASLNSVGRAYQTVGDAKKGLDYLERALIMMQALYPGDHRDVAISLNNVGLAYKTLGEVIKGIDYYERSLKMMQVLYPGNHPDVAASLNNVGSAYEALGDVRNSLDYHERSLKMRVTLYPGGHPDVVQSFNNVGLAYKGLGDIGKCNLYKRLSSLPKGFINKRGLVTGDIITVKQKLQKKVLNKIQVLSAKGEWSKRYMGFGCGGVSGYIDESYLEKQLGDLNSANNVKIALALCFEAITIGIANSEKQNLKCVSEFTITYPELIREYTMEHPEYFVLETIASFCLQLADYGIQFVPSSLDEGPIEEFKGHGSLSYKGKSYYEYYNTAIDKILAARLGTLDSRIKRLDSWYLTSVSKLAYKVSSEFTNSEIELVLAPVNLYNKHWLGLALRKLDDVIEVTYMDSEQKAILPGLMLELKNTLLSNRYESRFLRLRLEKQNYNNCGPELIENFVYYLTGTRAPQEGAVYLHSLLVENSLLDPQEYKLKIAENKELIEFLSNTASIDIWSIDVLTLSSSDLIRGSFEDSGDPSVKHEDDGGRETAIVINSMLHRASIWFKALDLAVDSARLVQEPTMALGKKLAVDYAYLQGMVSGVNGYSIMIGVAETMYQLQFGEYMAAFSVAAGTVSTMVLPVILAMANRPYLGLAYGVWIAASTAYGAITNAYSFATELGSSDWTLRSAIAYKDLAEWLAASSLQALYDFGAKAKEYKLQINDLLFEKEKSIVQAKVKGEFGQKVFDYIYLPELLKKYILLNDVIRGKLTEEEAQSLKSKPIAISYGALEYDTCVKTEDFREETTEHYYCCNIAGHILDHVVLTGGSLEVLENL